MLSEQREQVLLIRWFRLQHPKHYRKLFAIPNGGSRHVVEAMNLKESGVLAGVPDLMLIMARHGFHGLFIEMKTLKGRVSNEQKQFLLDGQAEGYKAVVCYGFEEAKKVITEYLN